MGFLYVGCLYVGHPYPSVPSFLPFFCDWGLTGIWVAMCLDLNFRGLICLLRFRKREWAAKAIEKLRPRAVVLTRSIRMQNEKTGQFSCPVFHFSFSSTNRFASITCSRGISGIPFLSLLSGSVIAW